MDFGRLDRLVALQSQAVSVGANGERKAGAWSTYASVWAEERQITAREAMTGKTEQAMRAMAFIIRWRSDVTERHRVVYDGAAYDITGIREIGRREALELLTERQQG